MDSFRAPSDLVDPALAALFETALSDLRRAHSAALDAWLKRCVETWCPKAWALANSSSYSEAHAVLVAEGFHWTQETIGSAEVATFWQRDTPIMRCKLEIQLLNREWARVASIDGWRYLSPSPSV